MSTPSPAGTCWRKSTRSNGAQACVEVVLSTTVAGIRDSKNHAGGALVISPLAFALLIRTAKSGQLDLS
jgi:Domain of unknown function (DUF397)